MCGCNPFEPFAKIIPEKKCSEIVNTFCEPSIFSSRSLPLISFCTAISLLFLFTYCHIRTHTRAHARTHTHTRTGIGEGCVMVAARTFVGHAFNTGVSHMGDLGAFAQGVLVAVNNLSMMVSKITIPWLIENNNSKMKSKKDNDASNCNDSIWIGIAACCAVQLVSLTAGVMYAMLYGRYYAHGITNRDHGSSLQPPQPSPADEAAGATMLSSTNNDKNNSNIRYADNEQKGGIAKPNVSLVGFRDKRNIFSNAVVENT